VKPIIIIIIIIIIVNVQECWPQQWFKL